jgi:hypothetical protein
MLAEQAGFGQSSVNMYFDMGLFEHAWLLLKQTYDSD